MEDSVTADAKYNLFIFFIFCLCKYVSVDLDVYYFKIQVMFI
jgi:hypothetical protein